MTTPDPVRWLDRPDPTLSDEAQASLQTYAERGPSAAARARMWSQLEAAARAPSAASTLPAATARTRWWWLGAGPIGLAALWLMLQPHAEVARLLPPPHANMRRVAPARAPSQQQVVPAQATQAPSRATQAPSRATQAPSRATQPSPGATAEPQASRHDDAHALIAPAPAEPRPSTRPRSHGGTAKPSLAAPAPATVPDPAAELALLSPARQLLAARPERSLVLADEHAQRFPQGLFAEERSFLRIEALLRLGHRPEAEREARAFRRRHPGSTYLERLDALLP